MVRLILEEACQYCISGEKSREVEVKFVDRSEEFKKVQGASAGELNISCWAESEPGIQGEMER